MRRLSILAAASTCALGATATDALAQTAADLRDLSLEELGAIEVTSVSKRGEPLRQAPSAIYVISRDDILRSGAETIPEILRLAPNLHVAQTSASRYVITARGLNGNEQAQAFSNKLLVLIDGRSVYSPLFSGVYWDMQEVRPKDIDRIEVISGPGATLWGANAVNGVINITTLPAADTQGFAGSATAGSEMQALGARYGGSAGDSVSFRVYGRGIDADATETAAGGNAGDAWERIQGGFRIDWTPADHHLVTLQGDAFDGKVGLRAGQHEDIKGRNLLLRWVNTRPDGSEIRAQAYYDRAERSSGANGSFSVDMFDLEAQHRFHVGAHEVVWGGNLRSSEYRINGTPAFFFAPAKGSLELASAFIQDTINLTPNLHLTLGLKVEDDPYVSAKPLYNARVAWTPSERHTLWAAVSTAVRSPTPFDRDVVEVLNGVTFVIGDADFRHEELTAYEAGMRLQPSANVGLSLSAFYNVYDDLRSIEPAPGGFLPLRWGNGMRGHTLGFETWAEFRPASWWRLTAGYSYLETHFDFDADSSGLLGVAQAGNDPKHRAMVRSSMDIGERMTLDADLRYVGSMRDPRLKSYAELNLRAAWSLTERLDLSVSGRNLLHEQHQEFAPGARIPRSVHAGLAWRF
ncbi:MAG: TonB-dependent receptor plug domain-containing protein [Pseudomonadota bacterium]